MCPAYVISVLSKWVLWCAGLTGGRGGAAPGQRVACVGRAYSGQAVEGEAASRGHPVTGRRPV